jgi:hypothetical protein
LWLGCSNLAGLGQAFAVAHMACIGWNNLNHWLCTDTRSVIPSYRPFGSTVIQTTAA